VPFGITCPGTLPPCPAHPAQSPLGLGPSVQPPDVCPPSGAAACFAAAVLATESDAAGNALAIPLSQSRAGVQWMQQPVQDGAPAPAPARNPQAHADAQQAGASYANALLAPTLSVAVNANAVYSRCDVAAGFDERTGAVLDDAYGRAGVAHADLAIASTLVGTHTVRVEALDFELEAQGDGKSASAWAACDIVEVVVDGNDLFLCAAPNGALSVPISPVATITIVVNEEDGPAFNFATGQWVYAGSALHVSIATIAGNADVWVGYVAVGVQGNPMAAAGPPTFVNPH
jgi:hypothetical protein